MTAGSIGAALPADPGERGTTTLADRVVARTAGQAATEIAQVSGLQRQVAGRTIGATTVRSQADLHGRATGLALELALDYPASVREVTSAVRAHVAETIERICGLTVDRVDITVAVLRPQRGRGPVQ